MTRDGLDQASHEELIELALAAHQSAEQEKERSHALDVRLQEVEQQLRWFKTQLFGTKSERRFVEDEPSQLCLGEPGSGQIAGEFGRVATLLLGWLL